VFAADRASLLQMDGPLFRAIFSVERNMNRSRLGPARSALVRLSASMASRTREDLREALREASRLGERVEVEESILQSYLFLGYPAALNTFALWREDAGGSPAREGEDDWAGWSERGEEVCRVVYGGQYDRLRRNVRALHPDMERWMVVEGYGKVLGRPGLDLATRELCIVALLAVLEAPRQLYSHLRGALSAGASTGEVESALLEAAPYQSDGGRDEARAVWARVRSRLEGRVGPPGT